VRRGRDSIAGCCPRVSDSAPAGLVRSSLPVAGAGGQREPGNRAPGPAAQDRLHGTDCAKQTAQDRGGSFRSLSTSTRNRSDNRDSQPAFTWPSSRLPRHGIPFHRAPGFLPGSGTETSGSGPESILIVTWFTRCYGFSDGCSDPSRERNGVCYIRVESWLESSPSLSPCPQGLASGRLVGVSVEIRRLATLWKTPVRDGALAAPSRLANRTNASCSSRWKTSWLAPPGEKKWQISAPPVTPLRDLLAGMPQIGQETWNRCIPFVGTAIVRQR
jgi:hypothetical protein